MARFNVRYVHKVTQICMCQHTQYGHAADLGDGTLKWGEGKCRSSPSCTCEAYVPRSEMKDVDLTDLKPTDLEAIVARVLGVAWPVGLVRQEPDGRIVAFFEKSTYHSIILTPVPG